MATGNDTGPAYPSTNIEEFMAANEPQKQISLKEALALAHKYGLKVTKATLTEWLDAYHEKHKKRLYHQPKGVGGKIYVFEESYITFLSGKSTKGA